jgi:uncharacterized protein (DUF2147 family)
MGFPMTERTYSKGNKSIKISLTGGASGDANNPFAAIAAFGMQATPGDKTRIHRRSALINDDNGTFSLTITLKSGGVLALKGHVSKVEIVKLGKAFPVVELDDSRR